jgi:hypothetical protein
LPASRALAELVVPLEAADERGREARTRCAPTMISRRISESRSDFFEIADAANEEWLRRETAASD